MRICQGGWEPEGQKILAVLHQTPPHSTYVFIYNRGTLVDNPHTATDGVFATVEVLQQEF